MSKGILAAVYSAKGGVGKTTFTLNLAGVLANSNKKTLIIDLDFYSGGVALSLNKEPKLTIYNYHNDVSKNSLGDINKYITKYNKYIDFISCPKSIKEAKSINFASIEKLIFDTSLLYDVILFDLSHIYSDINTSVLKTVSKVLFLFTNDPVDLKNTANMLPVLNKNNNTIKLILNNSIHFDRDYYILYDIKYIVKHNIDYIISNRFHNPDIDIVTVRGDIMTMNSQKLVDYKIFNLIANSLIKAKNR